MCVCVCVLQDDDKPMIEIMDQLSPAVMDSFVHVAHSDSVSTWLLLVCVSVCVCACVDACVLVGCVSGSYIK